MRTLDPERSEGLVGRVEDAVGEALRGQRERILREFSLRPRRQRAGPLGAGAGERTTES